MQLLHPRLGKAPQYVFHPSRVLRWVLRARAQRRSVASDADGQREVAELPWGLSLEVFSRDFVGFSIAAGGVFDPCVTEALHRLIDPGDLVADAGANVGYVTSLAAVRSGPDGRVLAFEPHPQVFELLERNATSWEKRAGVSDVAVHRTALSDRAGEGTLVTGPLFETNKGLAALASEPEAAESASAIPVPLQRLDDVLPAGERVGLLKVDVEGHEAEVLRGAQELLAGGRVRDIVFEDHNDYPSEATAIVEAAGYRLISLDNDLFGLRLGAPADRGPTFDWPGPSYLATRDARRAEERLTPRGWTVPGLGPRLTWPWRSRSAFTTR